MTTEAKWRERVELGRASGQSFAEYCKERPFKTSTLKWWARQLRRRATPVTTLQAASEQRAPSSDAMVRVIAKKWSAPIRVRVGSASIDIHAGFDAALLRAVVETLEGGR